MPLTKLATGYVWHSARWRLELEDSWSTSQLQRPADTHRRQAVGSGRNIVESSSDLVSEDSSLLPIHGYLKSPHHAGPVLLGAHQCCSSLPYRPNIPLLAGTFTALPRSRISPLDPHGHGLYSLHGASRHQSGSHCLSGSYQMDLYTSRRVLVISSSVR